MSRSSLNQSERLKSRKQIEALFKEGHRFVVSPLRVFYVAREGEPAEGKSRLQFGVGASTRLFKKAVDRNRVKRLGREAWRLQKSQLLVLLEQQNRQLDVFFIYTGKELPDFEMMFSATAAALKKLTGPLR